MGSTETTSALHDLLAGMVEAGASDLHIGIGSPPAFRVDGRIRRVAGLGTPSRAQAREMAFSIMTPEQQGTFAARRDLDFAYSLSGIGRFRVNALMRRGSVGLVIRHIPNEIPTGDQLGLPGVCRKLADRPRGLVVVTGPTGCGKSTSLAAIIDYLNSTRAGHIITLEDPVEFIHRDKQCIVTQRQIGDDTDSFACALRGALRQDPDIIMIGEMRDLETVELAITAAETGHLVFGTLHTTSAIATVDRIIDVFPHTSQQQVRIQLANSLQGIISQCLIPRIGGGRIAAHEVLLSNDNVRAMIRDGKTAQLLNVLQMGRGHGMTTLEERLVELVKEGCIEGLDAVRVANRPDDVEQMLKASAAATQAGAKPVSPGPGRNQ